MIRVVLGGALLLAATAALADTKAGVDAWGRGDYARAVQEWRGPAQTGDADAQFNLAQAYKLGRGVPVDLAQAEDWYRRAALQGHPQAEDNYGLALFQNGKRQEAVSWLEKSANRGEARAQYVLGTMYFNGDIVRRDWVRAYALMTRASGAGLDQATKTLGEMDRYIPIGDRQAGIDLARKIETNASRPVVTADAGPPPNAPMAEPRRERERAPIRTAELPPSRVRDEVPPPERETRAAEPAPVRERARETPRPRPAPAPRPVATSGPWKVQLGAFRDAGNAQALRGEASAKFGRAAQLVRAGAVTRVIVPGFASPAQAQAACRAARISPCVPVRN